MTGIFLVGLAGSLILVLGAALPDTPVQRAVQSPKDWCFALGGAVMLLYSILNYYAGSPVFFIFLEGLVTLSSIFMMFDVNEHIDTPVTVGVAIGLIAWSIHLAQGFGTVLFIIGLTGIAVGYELKMGSLQRELALIIGSIMIALFSYLSATWIFFWLNVFFALFSSYHAWKIMKEKMLNAPLHPGEGHQVVA